MPFLIITNYNIEQPEVADRADADCELSFTLHFEDEVWLIQRESTTIGFVLAQETIRPMTVSSSMNQCFVENWDQWPVLFLRTGSNDQFYW
jgi:hypothetical protein